jgi:hypothetical protein
MGMQAAFDLVRQVRQANEDVFVWPGVTWDLLYCHEELAELARVVQTLNAPDHARNSTDTSLSLADRLHLEWGQTLMMLVTLGIEAGITDPERALQMALDKVSVVSARKRGAPKE